MQFISFSNTLRKLVYFEILKLGKNKEKKLVNLILKNMSLKVSHPIKVDKHTNS